MKWVLSTLALSLAGVAPVEAAIWTFGGANASNLTSVTSVVPGEATLTVDARRFAVAPSALTNVAQLASPAFIDRNASRIGVTGGANAQLDTNNANAREAFLISSTRLLRITGAKLSSVDVNDTLLIYGVGAGGTLTALTGPSGTIGNGLDGTAAFINNMPLSLAQTGITSLTFNTPLAPFDAFVVTSRVSGGVLFQGDHGQGFFLDNLSGSAVPEPASWAMLIAGFALVGAAMRRRSRPTQTA
jgi:hypothetical protein